jgi:hypothetical protein
MSGRNPFWNNINKQGPLHPVLRTRCWLWVTKIDSDGYGRLGTRRAHRISWELANGQIPEDKWVLHKCDVRNCVRPSHLFLGSNQDNIADMVKKGRARKASGEAHGNSKLHRADIITIRKLYANGTLNLRELGEKYKVTRPAIGSIVSGRTWGEVE